MYKNICTQSRDKNGRTIWAGDTVRHGDGFTGRVVFENCAFRVDVTEEQDGFYLPFNSSLLYKEGEGTEVWEVVEQAETRTYSDHVPRANETVYTETA